MQYSVEFKHYEPQQRVRAFVERLIKRVGIRLRDFPGEAVFVRMFTEQQASPQRYQVSLTCRLPRRTLAAKQEGSVVTTTLRQAFAEIERQLERYKAELRGEPRWKRLARRAMVREKKRGESPSSAPQSSEFLRELINSHLRKLCNFVRREIASYQATGELSPGDLTTEDVVDATVLRAYQEFAQRPPTLEIDRWLVKLAVECLESEIKRLAQDREQSVRFEAAIPQAGPGEAVDTLGDELFSFYIELKEIAPDHYLPTPEDVAASRDLQRYMNRILAGLPKTWRVVFGLHHVEGFTEEEIAWITGQSETEVRQRLECVREYLRRQLLQSGLQERPEMTRRPLRDTK